MMITKIDEYETSRKDKNIVLRYFAIFNAKIIITQLTKQAKKIGPKYMRSDGIE